MKNFPAACAAFLLWGLAACKSGPSAADHPAYHNPVVQPYTDSIAGEPDNAGFYFRRAAALADIHMDSLALKDVEAARRLDTANPQYTYTAGYLQLQLNQPKAAIKTLLLNLEQSPGNVNVRLLLSKAYIADHDPARARTEIDKILAAAPGHAQALLMRAQLYAEEKDTVAAIAQVRQLLSVNPRDYEASYLLADWYKASGSPEAIAQYQYTFRLDTLDVSPLFEIGDYYEQKQDMPRAKDAYRDCIRRDLNYTDACMALGKILYGQDSTQKALRHFEMAIKTQPNSAEAYFNKGRCFEKLQQRDSAALAYRQALVFDGGLEAAAVGLKRLKGR